MNPSVPPSLAVEEPHVNKPRGFGLVDSYKSTVAAPIQLPLVSIGRTSTETFMRCWPPPTNTPWMGQTSL